MIENMRNGQPIRLYNEGTDIRDILHVKEVGDIIDRAKELLNSSSEIVSVPSPKFHSIVQTKDFWMDTTKLKSLGFEPQISTDDLIKQLCKI